MPTLACLAVHRRPRVASRWARDSAATVVRSTRTRGLQPGDNRAALLLAPVVRSTPLERCDRLSVAMGAPVLLKREDTQVVRSYKVRGAYNLIASLPADARAKGVVCASAGNHAQGVAFSCAALGIPGRVFLPATTPRQKREWIRAIGGDAVEILVRGSTYDETSTIAIEEAAGEHRVVCR